MEHIIELLGQYFLPVSRYVFVLLVLIIVIVLRRRLLLREKSDYVIAVLDIDDGTVRLPIMHYETTIGRSKSCDVVIPLSTVSRQHAVLTMTESGRWRIVDTKSAGGILINGERLPEDSLVSIGDEISIAGTKMLLMPATSYDAQEVIKQKKQLQKRRIKLKPSERTLELLKNKSVSAIFAFLNIFQILACYQLYTVLDSEHHANLFISFGVLFALPWLYIPVSKLLKIKNIAVEATAFFLCTIGMCVTAGASPDDMIKQLIAIILGLVVFCVMCIILNNLNLVMKLRTWTAVASLLLLGINIILGGIGGQNNWIRLGLLSVQPSELVKVLFVFTGSATLEWLLTTKNLTILTIYSVACIGCLFLIGDFGTALIFFFTFIILIFMTSGDIRAIVLTCVTAALGGLMVISYKPYIVDRFSAWRHVWENISGTGYQQARALIAIANGGLLGLGAGNGFLKIVAASDTDLVFGIICEEWGLIIGLLTISCYIFILLSAIQSKHTTRSSYYIIAACAAASLFIFQASLNIFGTTDILPLTGVTLPFISNGGSSMISSWGLLSFIAAARNFARPPKAKILTAPVKV